MSFKYTPLGDLLGGKGYIRGPFGSALKRDELKTSGIPVYEQQHAIYGTREFRYFIDEHKFNTLKRFCVEESDLIISCSGTVGKISIISANDPLGIISQALLILRPNSKKIIPEYLYYFFSSKKGFNELINASQGAVQLNIAPRNIVEKILIPTPNTIDEQYQIVNLLQSFDKKIELNNQVNQALEAMAQAIFKSWFVDFEPVKAKMAVLQAGGSPAEAELAAMMAISGKTAEQLNTMRTTQLEAYQQLTQTAALFPAAMQDSELGEIPEGWEVASLSNVCEFQNGFAFQSQDLSKEPDESYRVFKMGDIKKGGGLHKDSTKDWYPKYKALKLNRYILKKGDLLMCMTDMKNNVALLGHTALMDVDDEYILNQRVGLLRSKDKSKANYPFLYILTNSSFFIDDIRSRANSGVQVNLSTKGIKETKFILPSENVHGAFDKVASEIQEQIFSLQLENSSLQDIRDSLLPKLLSGEINLSALDEVVA